MKKSAGVIFGLVGHVLLGCDGWRRHVERCMIVGRLRITLAGCSAVKKAG